MKYLVLKPVEVKTAGGNRRLQPLSLMTITPEKAIDYIETGCIGVMNTGKFRKPNRCTICGCRIHWRSPNHNDWICQRCHPVPYNSHAIIWDVEDDEGTNNEN